MASRRLKVPFNRPSLVGDELIYVTQSLKQGHISGDGAFTKKCEELIEAELGVERVLLTPSCTQALELSALLLNIQPNDEIIAPSFTFVSTVNAFVLRGARPVFIDVKPDTLNLDESRLEQLVTKNTKAVIPVHYGGVACEMGVINDIASRHGVAVVEDNAHGFLGRWRARPLGTFGALATLSFHETKTFTCGEGGALLLNDERFVTRAEILREKGTNRTAFFRGEMDRYTWVDVGSSYLLSDLSAAVLWGQLEKRAAVQARRQALFERYLTALGSWAARSGVRLPVLPPHCESAYHLFYLLLPDLPTRASFIDWLAERGVHSVFHYVPLHTSPMGRSFGYRPGELPVTEAVSDQLVRLPLFYSLSADEQDAVIDAVTSFEP